MVMNMADKPTIKTTVSEGKAGKNCLYAHDLKYRQGFTPKRTKRPLKLGSWIHYCLENLYQDMGWQGALDDLVRSEWTGLWEEEKALLGPLPEDTARILEAYEYYYRRDPWELVLPPEVKFEIPVETRDFIVIFQGRVDLVVKDGKGAVWCIDHKSTRTIPSIDSFRAMDFQLTIYPWALARQYGVHATGTMYNYLRTRAPTIPKQLKSGLLSKRKIKTDELTFRRALKEYDLEVEDYQDQLAAARRSTADFFFRARVPRNKYATVNVVRDMVATAIHLNTYRFPLRNVTPNCERCDFLELCQTRMFGLDDTMVLQQYEKIDPYAYLHMEDDDSW